MPRKPNHISREQLVRLDKKIRRESMIKAGQRNTPPPKVHRSKKDYYRKIKHKNKNDNQD